METEKRDLIVKSAISEFRAKGFHGLGMNELARKANVSKRTLYKYFHSKEELFEAVTTKLFAEIKLGVTYPRLKNKSFDFLIEEIIESYIFSIQQKEVLNSARIILAENLQNDNYDHILLSKLFAFRGDFKKWLDWAKREKLFISEFQNQLLSDYFHRTLSGMIFYPLLFKSKSKFSSNEIKEIKKLFLMTFKALYTEVHQ